MADRIYPASKPAAAAATTGATNVGSNPKFPPTKGQLYNSTTRPLYRPPMKRRHSRSCFCSCCLWTTILIIVLLLLVAVAGVLVWVIYRPHRPSFSVSSLQLSKFNLTSTGVTSNFNVALTTRNPNKKIVYYYDPINVSIFSEGVDIGDGSFPGFEHGTKNTTTLKTVISSSGQSLDSTEISTLRSDLKNQNSLPLKIQLDTKVKAKIGKFKTKKVGIKVTCDGFKIAVPNGKTPATASTSNVNCKVDLRIKIWKWTI